MACFGRDELVDCIRHNIRLLDDSQVTAKIILSPQRRIPPGSLPSEMCRNSQWIEEEKGRGGGTTSLLHQLESNSQSQQQQFQLENTQSQIRARFLAKLNDLEQSCRANWADLPVAQRPVECTIQFDPRQQHQDDKCQQISLTARLLNNTIVDSATDSFAEFAKFEAFMTGASDNKRFNILFPFCEQTGCVLPIWIFRTAYIADLIGLACHVYTREKKEPPCDQPSEYDLYLAEEDLVDFDTELPPQDRRRRVAECGFSNLAMVKRTAANRQSSHHQRMQQHQLGIFLVDGRCYTMDVECLDIPLRQVFDYAMQRKQGEEKAEAVAQNDCKNFGLFRKLDYVLEPLDQPGTVLDLNDSVSSSGSSDFVLLRVNSARGDAQLLRQSSHVGRHLHSRSMEFGLLENQVACSPDQNIDWARRRGHFSVRKSSSQQPPSSLSIESATALATLGRRSGADLVKIMLDQSFLDGGAILEEYKVNRIHRFQPKTPVRLLVRERLLELVPQQSSSAEEPKKKSKSSTMTKVLKSKQIPWELLAAVEVPPNSEQRANSRRIVRLIVMGGASHFLVQQIIESGKAGRPVEANPTFEGTYWKTILVEATAHEAWQIGVRVRTLV